MALDWRAELAKRPWWMNAMLAFCAYMTFVYMPFDLLFKPVAEDQEVWFGIMLSGWAAKRSTPPGSSASGAWRPGCTRGPRSTWPRSQSACSCGPFSTTAGPGFSVGSLP